MTLNKEASRVKELLGAINKSIETAAITHNTGELHSWWATAVHRKDINKLTTLEEVIQAILKKVSNIEGITVKSHNNRMREPPSERFYQKQDDKDCLGVL